MILYCYINIELHNTKGKIRIRLEINSGSGRVGFVFRVSGQVRLDKGKI